MVSGFDNQRHWLPGELAKAAGVSRDLLRHYERKGVLPRPRRAKNGYRMYPESALGRVLLVRRALLVGFTLDELAVILNERDKGGAPCREVHKLAAQKLLEIEERIAELLTLRNELQVMLTDWEKRLAAVSDIPVRLLETLETVLDDKNRTLSTRSYRKRNLSPDLKSKKKEGKK